MTNPQNMQPTFDHIHLKQSSQALNSLFVMKFELKNKRKRNYLWKKWLWITNGNWIEPSRLNAVIMMMSLFIAVWIFLQRANTYRSKPFTSTHKTNAITKYTPIRCSTVGLMGEIWLAFLSSWLLFAVSIIDMLFRLQNFWLFVKLF